MMPRNIMHKKMKLVELNKKEKNNYNKNQQSNKLKQNSLNKRKQLHNKITSMNTIIMNMSMIMIMLKRSKIEEFFMQDMEDMQDILMMILMEQKDKELLLSTKMSQMLYKIPLVKVVKFTDISTLKKYQGISIFQHTVKVKACNSLMLLYLPLIKFIYQNSPQSKEELLQVV